MLLISDTHLPRRSKDLGGNDLPAPVWDAVDAVDVVIHAGDWVDAALLDDLQARSARLVGCWGSRTAP